MPLTSTSDLYGAIHDDGINRLVRNLMRQRPSLFNYGTALVKANPGLLCSPIDAAPDVTELITLLPRLPLFPAGSIDLGSLSEYGIDLSAGGGLALDYAVQLTDLQVDFSPGNVFALPPELGPPLDAQQLAFQARVCGGLSCIPKSVLKKFPHGFRLGNPGMVRQAGRRYVRRAQQIEALGRYSAQGCVDTSASAASSGPSSGSAYMAAVSPGLAGGLTHARAPSRLYPMPLPLGPLFPIDRLQCFCMELFATAHSDFEGQAGAQRLSLDIDGIELKDLAPEGLENSIECYMRILMDRVILPQVADAVSENIFRMQEIPSLEGEGTMGSIQISAATQPAHNPAVEANQLKLFLNLEELAITIPPIEIGTETGTSPPTRTKRARTRTGPAHITGAVSEAAFQRVFGITRDTGRFRIKVAPRTMSLFGFLRRKKLTGTGFA